MKFRLENVPSGALICHIIEPLTQPEALQIIKGIEKVLANGRARVIVGFSRASASSEGGAVFLEENLRPLKGLAKKMGGDIRYVVPALNELSIPGAVPEIQTALDSFFGPPAETTDRMGNFAELTAENRLLREKVKDLLLQVSQPSSDRELKAAVEHYKTLATALEANPPAGSSKPQPT